MKKINAGKSSRYNREKWGASPARPPLQHGTK
jgi:hypothetical protein